MIQENELEINEKEINDLFEKAIRHKFEMELNSVYISLDKDGIFYYDLYDTNKDDLFTYTIDFYNEDIQVDFKSIMNDEDYEKYVSAEYSYEELGYEQEINEDYLKNSIVENTIEFYAELYHSFETEYIE